MHFEEKILEKKHVYILVTKVYYWNIQRTWNGHQKVDIDRFTPKWPRYLLLPLVPKGGSMEPPKKPLFYPNFAMKFAPYMYELYRSKMAVK